MLEFAFCYPYSYESVCATVDALARANLGDDVYLRRETLTTSLEGRPVELLTITANDDTYFGDEPLDWHAPQNSTDKSTRGGLAFSISSEGGDDSSDDGEDSGPEGTNKPSLSKPPLLTPHRKDTEVRRCAKREVIISARVHPGETPAQFVVDGLLAAVLADGPVGQALREAYVWRVVPCLNPDGVARGHYRMGSVSFRRHRRDTLRRRHATAATACRGRATPAATPSSRRCRWGRGTPPPRHHRDVRRQGRARRRPEPPVLAAALAEAEPAPGASGLASSSTE